MINATSEVDKIGREPMQKHKRHGSGRIYTPLKVKSLKVRQVTPRERKVHQRRLVGYYSSDQTDLSPVI